jgi:hypothetical protein
MNVATTPNTTDYRFMITLPEGGAGPTFTATHEMPAAMGDCAPLGAAATAVKYILVSGDIPSATGSKVTEVSVMAVARGFRLFAERPGSVVQYAV